MGYLADPKYLKYKGFQSADAVSPYFELMYLPFSETADKPYFKSHIKMTNRKDKENGFILYYTSQCPFTAKYVPILEDIAKSKNIDFQAVHLDTTQLAQNAPSPFTTFSLFYNGKLITPAVKNKNFSQ